MRESYLNVTMPCPQGHCLPVDDRQVSRRIADASPAVKPELPTMAPHTNPSTSPHQGARTDANRTHMCRQTIPAPCCGPNVEAVLTSRDCPRWRRYAGPERPTSLLESRRRQRQVLKYIWTNHQWSAAQCDCCPVGERMQITPRRAGQNVEETLR